METTPWQKFFEEKMKLIFRDQKSLLDIGGGLRVAKDKNNRYDPQHAWLLPYLENMDYKVLDPVPDYHPDIVGDIHELPFPDGSLDAISCIAVLEHVRDPFKAAHEMHRVLKPGGYCYVFVPFLYYYHPLKGYYQDYWRFTLDGVKELFKDFSAIEVQNVRGASETVFHLLPFASWIFSVMTRLADKISGKTSSNQTSGYNVFLIK